MDDDMFDLFKTELKVGLKAHVTECRDLDRFTVHADVVDVR